MNENDEIRDDDKNESGEADGGLNRRDFFLRSSALSLGLLMGGSAGVYAQEIKPAPAPEGTKPASESGTASKPVVAAPSAPPVGCAVIGLGEQGRLHLKSLAYVPGADVRYVCDTYEALHKRGQESHPKAAGIADYRKALDDKDVKAVWVCTPSHQHKEIVLAALAAGKSVYCEAPLASSIEDAKAIAKAALAAPKQTFHVGLQQRTNPQHNHVVKFVRTGALGNMAHARAQWHKKTSWRRAASGDREKDLNWRLSSATSGGLMGEIGVHQVDVANWFMKELPVAVTGSGAIIEYKDGRDVADTVQCLIEYPGNVYLSYNATLVNSFDGGYEMFQGDAAAIIVKDGRAWMFKENDAPQLGWEVYATKEAYGDSTGIVLVADATKLLAAGEEPGKHAKDTDPTKGALYFAGDAFLSAVRAGKQTDSGAEVGYQATVTALRCNEAIKTNGKIMFGKADFDLA